MDGDAMEVQIFRDYSGRLTSCEYCSVSHVLEDPAPESCGQGHMVFLLWRIFAAEFDFLLTSCDVWFSLISFKACSVSNVLWDPTLNVYSYGWPTESLEWDFLPMCIHLHAH
ncbi:hypothetical protein AKJ16_DCAP06105 [Drosera capensis]